MATRKKVAAEAWAALLRVHAALVPELDRVVQHETGLPLSWYDVLLELAYAPDRRLRMSDLAQRVVLSRTRVSRVVDDMVRAGLLHKQSHPADGRSSFAVLTKAGQAQFDAAAPVYVRAIEEHFAAALTNDELGQVAALLNAVLAEQSDRAALLT